MKWGKFASLALLVALAAGVAGPVAADTPTPVTLTTIPVCEEAWPPYFPDPDRYEPKDWARIWSDLWGATVNLGPPPVGWGLAAGTEQGWLGWVVIGQHARKVASEGSTDVYVVERTMAVLEAAQYLSPYGERIWYWWAQGVDWNPWRQYIAGLGAGVYTTPPTVGVVGYCCRHETWRRPADMGPPQDWGRRCSEVGRPVEPEPMVFRPKPPDPWSPPPPRVE